MRKVVIVGPPPVQILDVTGPLEVFSNVPDYEVQLGNPGSEHHLQTSRGQALSPATPIADITAPIDTLVIVGGPGAETGVYDPQFVSWIANAATHSRRVAYTSAGITAGIDLCLALVEEDHGHQVALNVARFLVMFLVRPGGQDQYSHMLSRQAVTFQPLRELQVWMLENLRDDLTVEKLADRIGMSARHFTRVCLKETAMNPGQLVDRMRIEAAQQMIDASAMGLKEIADACGFGSADSMRRAFLRVLGVTAGEYASRFKSTLS